MKCTTCGLVFTDIPAGYDLSKIYDEGYFTGQQSDGYANYEESEPVLHREFHRLVAILRKLTNYQANLKLLEVGSAFGYFLDEACKYFKCSAFEVSELAAQYAQARGHHVFHGSTSEELLEQIGKVDIIVMLDVIEHLPNPVETMILLDKFLNDGGIFLLVTGDIDSFLARVMKKRWRLMTPPQHAYFFSKKTLIDLFRRFDYEIGHIDRPWKFVSLGLAFYQFLRHLGVHVKPIDQLNKVGIYLNLFDTVRIIAKKGSWDLLRQLQTASDDPNDHVP